MTDAPCGHGNAHGGPCRPDYRQRVADTLRDLEGLRGIIEDEDLSRRLAELETVSMLVDTYERGETVVALIVELGLESVREGLDRPDRLATAYRVADLARSVASMAEQLTVAEALYDSDLGDSDLGDIEETLKKIEMDIEFSSPSARDA